jgi:hypothetical protein
MRYMPKPIKKLDQYLRINYPWLWETRIHINLFMAGVILLLFVLLGFLFKIDLTEVLGRRETFQLYLTLFIPAFIWLVYMIYTMVLFNSEKSFGYRFKYQELFVFLIYLVTFSLPLLVPYSTVRVIDFRTGNLISDKKLMEDMQAVNYGSLYFPLNLYDYNCYSNDSIYLEIIEKGIDSEILRNYELDYYTMDSIFKQIGRFSAQRPKLYFKATSQFYISEEQDSLLREFICKRNIDKSPDIAKEKINKYINTLRKYSDIAEINEDEILSDYLNNEYIGSYTSKVIRDDIIQMLSTIERITAANELSGSMYDKEPIWVLFFFVFYLAIAFNVFKNVHWKQLILSIVFISFSLILLAIIDLIYRSEGNIVLCGSLLIIIIGLIISFEGFRTKRFSVIVNQSVALLNFTLPILPFLILFFMDEILDFYKWPYFDKYMETYETTYGTEARYSSMFYALKETVIQFTIWGGLLFYTFFWNSYLKVLYIKFWSLPKKS